MKRIFSDFASTALLLGGIVGLYFGAVPLKLVWLFWVIIALSVLVALFKWVLPTVLEYAHKVRQYETLKADTARLESDNERLKERLKSDSEESAETASSLIEEGQKQVIGAILAATYGDSFPITGIGIDGAGELFLVADWEDSGPVMGSRWSVEVRTTGASRGVVEVVDITPKAARMTLRPVERPSTQFWERLERDAPHDASPPTDVLLVPSEAQVALLERLGKKHAMATYMASNVEGDKA